MRKNYRIISILLSVLILQAPAFAGNTTLQEIENLTTASTQATDPSKSFDKNHWAYRTLENVTKKYGLLVGDPNVQFDINKPMTRKEAAILFVNLSGKIQQDNLTLSDAEKAQLDILKQELDNEIQELAGRVDKLENSVAALQGGVSKLEKSDSSVWKSDFGEKFKVSGGFIGKYQGNFRRGFDNPKSNFSMPVVDVTFSGKLQKHLNFVTNLFPSRNYNSTARGMLGDAYVSTDIIPHHTVLFGQARVPIGQEGAQSPYTIETMDKAQIARYYSDYRDTGVKVIGNWNFVDYYAGMFNGMGNNSLDLNKDPSYVGWLVLKPLYRHPELGSLEFGGGYDSGRSMHGSETYGFYTGYKYKKYAIKAEYAQKLGFGTKDIDSRGWYLHNSYFLTKKLQLVARFDQFDPNTSISDNFINEYTVGTNYYIANNNIKLMCDLVYVQNTYSDLRDSIKLVVGTQYKF